MKGALFIGMIMMLGQVHAQQSIHEVSSSDVQVVASELERESKSEKHDKKTRRMLKKVAESFKEAGQSIRVEVESLDDCSNCENKSKEEVIISNIGRKLGKLSAAISVATAKPFLSASGFLTGIFEKPQNNQDIVALYQFLLNHSQELDQLYLKAGKPEELVELMLAQIEVIVENKTRVILNDTLKTLGIKRELPADLSDFELSDEEIASIDRSKLTPDLVNKHPEYQELLPLIGEVSQDELEDLVMIGYSSKYITLDNYKQALPKIHEGVLTIATQVAVPRTVLGIISGSLAGLYATPVVLSNVGTGISAAVCLQKPTQDKFQNDKDLREFCSFVVNRSAYQLTRARAKGYVSGKNLRQKIEKKIADHKERRKQRKSQKQTDLH